MLLRYRRLALLGAVLDDRPPTTSWGRGDRLAPMPRHRELGPGVVRTICNQLDVDPPISAL